MARPRARDMVASAWCAIAAAAPTAAQAHRHPSVDERAMFRETVQDYQMFVVAHCAPEQVRIYVAARAARDAAFVRSLRKAGLLADYRQAVADQAEKDARTAYECQGPPPPPPPSGASEPAAPLPIPMRSEEDALAAHFKAGDHQYGVMVEFRDRILHPPHRP